MKLAGASAVTSITTLFLASSVSAQTYSNCNPLQQTCPPDPALGGSSNTDFTSGQSSDYTGTGNGVSYGSSGAQLSVSQSGDNPTLTSDWYIMFGRVDFTMKSAPGTGIVSSAILISDDLDEIDWELLGSDSSQAQTNYFSKGVTGAYDRGSFASVPSSQTDFNTYTIIWTSESISWQINGSPVRSLTYSETGGQYPQSPMQVKVGAWAGGDSSNSQGTVEWAGGPTDYSAGPYSMYVQSINVQDYSTGTEYRYDGTSGSWQDISAVGGSISGSASGSNAGSGSSGTPTNPTVPSNTWDGTHQETSAYSTPSVYPWVPASSAPQTTAAAAGPPASSYLASLGYDTSSAPKATPTPASSTRSSSPSSPAVSAAAAGCETVTIYNQQGTASTVSVPAGYTIKYDDRGFLIPPPPCGGAVRMAKARDVSPTTLAVVTGKLVPAQANVAAPAHSSQAPDDRNFYQTTETTQGVNPLGNGGERTVAGFTFLAILTAGVAFIF